MLTIEEINLLTLVTYPDPVLRREAERIEILDTWVEHLARRMIDLMRQYRGVGLAGNQVGLPLQIFVANPSGEPADDLVMINPEIIDATGTMDLEEGCLSLPDVRGKIRRHRHVILNATDLTGKRVEIETDELLARIFQHETDHLSGTLIFNRMSAVGRLAVRRQLKRLEEQA